MNASAWSVMSVAEVVALLGGRRLLDGVVVVDEVGVPLVGLRAEEAVEPLEAAPERPLAPRRGQVHLVLGAQVPLPDHVGVPAPLAEHLGDVAALEGDVPARVREPGRRLGDAGHAVRRVVAARSAGTTGSASTAPWCGSSCRPARWSAIRLMFGVSIRPPNGSIAEKPTSSSTMYSTFGDPSGATGCAYGSPVRGRLRDVQVDDAIERLGHDVPYLSESSRCHVPTQAPAGVVGGRRDRS